MSKRLLTLSLLAVAALSGCVTVPAGPAVAVMPGPSKNFDQFRVDDDACRQFAQSVVAPQVQAANDQAVGSAVLGAAIGAAAGAVIGSPYGTSGQGAAWGAGSGMIVGSAAGANQSMYSSAGVQRMYDINYMQCMSARGNSVPGRRVVAYRPPASASAPAPNPNGPYYAPPNAGYPPPNTPPPNYPPPNTPPPTF
jgi:uncharacterized protein YcfJ